MSRFGFLSQPANQFPTGVVSISGLLLMAGLWMVFARGKRRPSSEPHCHRCDYNLTGLPSDRCPECGTLIDPSQAVRRRRRRAWRVRAGLIPMIAAVWICWQPVNRWSRTVDWYQYRPTWLIMRDLPHDRVRAVVELARRSRLGELDQRRRRQVIDELMAIQKDRAQPWNGVYGDFIEAEQSAQRLPDEKWRTYGKQQLSFCLRVRPEVRQGDPLPIELVTFARRGNSNVAPFSVTDWTLQVDVSDVRGETKLESREEGGIFPPYSGDEYTYRFFYHCSESPLGRHTVHAKLLEYNLSRTPRPLNVDLPTEFELDDVTFTLLPRETDAVMPVDDPAIIEKVKQCIAITNVIRTPDGTLLLDIAIDHAPVDLVFHMSLQSGTMQWNLGDLVAPKGGRSDPKLAHRWVKDAQQIAAKGLAIRFEPAPELARQSTNLMHYLKHELVIPISISSDSYMHAKP